MKVKSFKMMISFITVMAVIVTFPISSFAINAVGAPPVGWLTDTPSTNVFKIAGDTKEFVLLNIDPTNENSAFFIFAKNHYGKKNIYPDRTSLNSGKFVADDPQNIAYWLNNDFISNGNTDNNVTYKLPSAIIDNIDYNHEWTTEPAEGVSAVPHTTTCGLALMSQTEWNTNYTKFGARDDIPVSPWVGWWLRSCAKLGNNIYAVTGQQPNYGAIGSTQWLAPDNTSFGYVRPVFYLKRDFFKKAKMDISRLGDDIKAVINALYTGEEMQSTGLYTIGELIGLGYTEFGQPPQVSNVTVSGIAKPGKTLTGNYQYFDPENKEEFDSDLTWLSSSSENGPYSTIPGAIGRTYTIKNSDKDKYIKFQVMPQNSLPAYGLPVQSSATIKIPAGKGPCSMVTTSQIPNFELYTPPENVFSIDNSSKKFILLNTTENNDSKFFVLTQESYGYKLFDPDKSVKFDVNDSNNIAYWLNDAFITEGNGPGNKLPTKIVNYIDSNHVWDTEAGAANSKCPDDYETTAGIALISKEELVNNYKKIGLKDELPVGGGWYLRTARGDVGDGYMLAVRTETNLLGQANSSESWIGSLWFVRPSFYLNRDFFTNVKLDVSNLGENVKKAIIQNYSAAELQAGAHYTKSELESIGFVNTPKAQNVSIRGSMVENEKLTGLYNFFAPDGKSEMNSTYRWFFCDEREGNYLPIEGATAISFTLDPFYSGKYIKLQVTPKNEMGLEGESVTSPAFGPIRTTQDITVNYNDFTDKNGGSFNGLSNAQSIKANISITNKTSESKQVILMISLHDGNNKLLKLVNKTETIAAGINTCSISMDLDNYSEGQTVRAVVVGDMEKIRPLSIVKQVQ